MTKTIEELLKMQKFLNWNRALEKPLVEIGFEYEVFKQAQALLSQGEPVYQVDNDGLWEDLSKIEYESHDDGCTLRILYRATPSTLQGEPTISNIETVVPVGHVINEGAGHYGAHIKDGLTHGTKLFTAPPSTSQGEPDLWVVLSNGDYIDDENFYPFYDEQSAITKKQILEDEREVCTITAYYKSPPSTEALQKDKAELIEYAENIRGALDAIMLFGTDIDKAKEFTKMALDIPQPKCMEE